MRTALEIVFWVSVALIVWTQVGYAAALAIIARVLAALGAADAGASGGGPLRPEPLKRSPPPPNLPTCR